METLNIILQKYQEFENEKQKLIEQVRKEFSNIFNSSLLKNSNKIETFSWTQYTPYFMDGDPCEFSVHLDYPDINGEEIYSFYTSYNDNAISFLYPAIECDIENEEQLQIHNMICEKYGYESHKLNKVGREGYKLNPNFDEKEYQIYINIKQNLQKIPEEILKQVLGDHCKVTISKNSDTIEVEEYMHD